MSDRAKVHVSDLIMAVVVSAAALALAPVVYDLVGDLSASAGPLSSMLGMLVVPLIFIGIVVSVSVSARRRV